jgi:hypothetical protein
MRLAERSPSKDSSGKSGVLALLFIGCSMLGAALLLAVWSVGPWH